MFRNMACSLIRSVRVDEDDKERPKVPGRIVTTLAKAKELRPFVEKLVTIGRKVAVIEEQAAELATGAPRNSDDWRTWRDSERWNDWNQAVAPAVALRRRAFALLRDNQAVDVLCDELAERFADRPGGYTRVVRLAEVRLGDAGQKALIEFVGERDRERIVRKHAPAVVDDEETPAVQEEPTDELPAAESQAAAGDEPEKKPE
jgi:large subunit ribosomal protein L17